MTCSCIIQWLQVQPLHWEHANPGHMLTWDWRAKTGQGRGHSLCESWADSTNQLQDLFSFQSSLSRRTINPLESARKLTPISHRQGSILNFFLNTSMIYTYFLDSTRAFKNLTSWKYDIVWSITYAQGMQCVTPILSQDVQNHTIIK